ncbi:YqaA family protein [Avibacterium paragallinarum]|uniref:DedA family protein n=1 Tax=Avibacterium paragallinarum TaxID=728 RepID=A0A2V4FL21_AVIPA|nr:YqaA family protein [Avibacterium paragallinarum]KAA6210076.1 DedA family protein [Avibacterium paragallinarum]MEE3607519.1 YqaA family protein [Avibacterium paragallinarum]MEE3620105.1 YqaA family protein [Avibacterium paragallinarum]MEE3667789.1 YqaA family protein [Avibacterium paragallinarum]MEE3680017.1 YqaA family protein [Avibacterium paragallinarum]
MFDLVDYKLFDQQNNSLWIMFISAFLSSTVLPGNSEIMFLFLTAPFDETFFSVDIFKLVIVAVIGNTLGGMTTYIIGRCFPHLEQRNLQHSWALKKIQRYGIWTLLFSWFPIVGDAFCALAGWLRLNWFNSLLLILIGKLFRYLLLLIFNQV